MIPDYQALMRPVLDCAKDNEVKIGDIVDPLADRFELSDEEREEILPSGKRFRQSCPLAKSYLKQGGLVKATKRGHFVITDRGRAVLADEGAEINKAYLEQFEEFKEFQARTRDVDAPEGATATEANSTATPDEALRDAHKRIDATFSVELLDRVREASAAFFERLIVELLRAMGYGGTSENAGRTLGKSGDNGVDGVIDQDLLGVDQIYIQAKRYAEGNNVSSGAIRDFFGALSVKKAQKGIFVTTSSFSPSAIQTARDLGMRIVLVDGVKLASLMIQQHRM